MSDQYTPIEEEDIHAYVDGTLSEERRRVVEEALERNPDLAARVSDYFSLNSMFHDRYDRVLSEPVPKRLQTPMPRRWLKAANWPQFAGLAAALVIGVGIGVGTNVGRDTVAQMSADGGNTHTVSYQNADPLARQAAFAHVVYMPSVYRPATMMSADQEQEFVQVLANKLGTDVRPPNLTKSGLELMGGRVFNGNDGSVAQFWYRDGKNERITLCISHRKVSSNTTAFKLYQDGSVNVFYWVDGNFGYAISGGMDRATLLQLSHDVYAQVTAATPG
ncbi:anti-sigma factor [Trinickia violacea]|uniref:Anti-sigma factor n=1 Tax=Trinickia violacea TaxID=2571746 RepID=A0A4V1EIE3_9BURK|nr:anti-sigma factor [Trinickia violacea]QCP53470.1 anti-sigma factor [Trinickia violacea]